MLTAVEPLRPRHRVFLVRHGRTALNMEGRFQGGLDVPLDEVGREQARNLGEKLSGLLSPKDRGNFSLVSSPLQRAIATMEIIARCLGRDCAEVSESPELAEMRFGRWEGLTTDEVRDRYPAERKTRRADRWNVAPEGGESHADIAQRLSGWIGGLPGPVIAVTHLGVMRTAAAMCGGYKPDQATRIVPGPLEIWRVDDSGIKVL